MIASGLRPGVASARAASAAISSSRAASTWPSAAPSVRRISREPFERLREARDDRRLGGAALVLALLGLGHLDHALERQDAVERRRRGVDLAAQAP